MDINSHEDISGVHRGTFRKLSDWFPSVCLGWPYPAFTKTIAQCTRNRMQCSDGNKACASCAAELTDLNSFQNLNNHPR